MNRPLTTLLVLGCFFVVVSATSAASADKGEKAPSLVKQLGSPLFGEREEAEAALLKIGPPAKAALLAGAHDVDLEIAYRSEHLLVVILEEDFKTRLQAFIEDKEGKQEHDLPGLARYQKLVGTDATAREMYIEMANTNRKLLQDADTDPKLAADRYAGDCMSTLQRMWGQVPSDRRQPTFAEIAVLLFISSDPNVPLTDQSRQLTINLLYQPVFQQPTKAGPRSAQSRKLLTGFLMQSSGQVAVQCLNVAQQFQLKEGLDLAVKLIKNKDFAFGQAITTIGKLGNKDQLPILEPLLKDETVLMPGFQFGGQQLTTQVRDVALAMSVALNGQTIKEFGFEFIQNNEQAFQSPILVGFGNDTKRKAAFKKYQDWLDKQQEKKDK
jgi:hypothetical protein